MLHPMPCCIQYYIAFKAPLYPCCIPVVSKALYHQCPNPMPRCIHAMPYRIHAIFYFAVAWCMPLYPMPLCIQWYFVSIVSLYIMPTVPVALWYLVLCCIQSHIVYNAMLSSLYPVPMLYSTPCRIQWHIAMLYPGSCCIHYLSRYLVPRCVPHYDTIIQSHVAMLHPTPSCVLCHATQSSY